MRHTLQRYKTNKPAIGPNLSVNFLQSSDILRRTMQEVFLWVWALLLGLGLARPVRVLYLKSTRTGDTNESLKDLVMYVINVTVNKASVCLV